MNVERTLDILNSLTVKVDWDLKNNEGVINGDDRSGTHYAEGSFEVDAQRIHKSKFDQMNMFYNDRTGVFCVLIGYISNIAKIQLQDDYSLVHDVQIVEKLYSQKGLDFIYDLDGIFIIFIRDLKKQKAYLLQDEFGSILPVYYANVQNKFLLSTSLKKILPSIPAIERRFNYDAANDFLFFKYLIPNHKTLIENIYKLIPGHLLVFDEIECDVSIKRISHQPKRIKKSLAKKRLITSIQASIHNLTNYLTNQKIFCTLSGGFDSTLIFHILNMERPQNITAVTIGGRYRDEIPSASKTVEYYGAVAHLTENVASKKLDMLPDMVWRLEGYTCERGIMMQHELGTLLARNECECIFLGEGADQIMEPMWNRNLREIMKKMFLMDIYEKYRRGENIKPSKSTKIHKKFGRRASVEYDIYFDSIIKKTGIMLNSFNIQGLYPFINKDTVNVCRGIGNSNFEKRFFRKEIKKVVRNEVYEYLKNIGGSTDSTFIFQQYPDTVNELLKSNFIKAFLGINDINKISKNYLHYSDLILIMIFLYLFNELFVSGKFDSKFEEPQIDTSIKDFFYRNSVKAK